ncbi:MAG: glycosyltransferase [Firmicutes bacterium]|nr:glycosyltransferase [Bacillota bacterium]
MKMSSRELESHKLIRVEWEGPQFVNHSYAVVNRHICSQLLKSNDIVLRITPTQEDSVPFQWLDSAGDIVSSYDREINGLDVLVRQVWPPSFLEPDSGKLVLFQPWEFGTIPRDWVPRIQDTVHEIWVNSEYTKSGYVRSGIDETKIFTFPLGIDPEIFCPDGDSLSLDTKKHVKFLFVGGTIYRKGIDKLLKAYVQEFGPNDDVCLVVKDVGTNSFYSGQTHQSDIKAIQSSSSAPDILYLTDDMTPIELASLYRSCDALVHPFRAEGFGLPILEAMACGVCVAIPDKGPAIEFTNLENSYRMYSEIVKTVVPDLDLVLPAEIIEVNHEELRATLRKIYENITKTRSMGKRAADHVHTKYTWDIVSEIVIDRLKALCSNLKDEDPGLGICLSPDRTFRRIAHRFEAGSEFRSENYKIYLPCFNPNDKVIDMGAGDGTWIKLLRSKGVNAQGVDIDPAKVEQMVRDGLPTVLADICDYVDNLNGRFDGFTMIHIIEHLPPEEAVRILRTVSKKLSYRGRILIVTPNFESPIVSSKNFWLDVTHVRPYPLELLQVMLQECGFRTIVGGKAAADYDSFIFGSRLLNDNPFQNV